MFHADIMQNQASDVSSVKPDLWKLVPPHVFLHGWFVEPRAGLLRRGEVEAHIEPKVMGVLVVLMAHQGEVVSRDTFFDLVWPDVIVTESALNRCVSDLRRVLGDDARNPTIIETIPKAGYRLLPGPEAEQPPVLATESTVGGDSAVAGEVVAVEPVPAPAQAEPAPNRLPAWYVPVTLLALTVVMVGLWIAVRTPPGWLDALQEAPVRVLTTLPGAERMDALSPDGRRIAFISQAGDETKPPALYVQSLNATAPHRLTEGPDWFPAWSPDGQTLAFQRRHPGEGNTGFSAVIYTVSEYGTDERLLASEGVAFGGLSWSPDGGTIAYVGQESPSGIFLLDIATGQRTRVTQTVRGARDLLPAFSPDGSEVAFVRRFDPYSSDLYKVAVDNGTPVRVTQDEAQIAGYSWMPDGNAFLVSSDRAGLFRLWQVASGEAPQLVPVPAQDPGRPSIHAAGILTFADWQYDTNVWLTSPGDTSAAQPVFESTRWDEQPALSPDGKRLAFVSSRAGRPELWVGDLDEERPARLADFEGRAVHAPRWSPKGTALAFQVHGEDGFDIYTIPAEGGRARRLTTHPAQDANPRWSRDGHMLYFASDRSGDWEIWRVPAAGGDPARITQAGGFVAEEDAAGEQLYFVKRYAPGLYAIPLADTRSDPQPVLDTLSPVDWGNWTVTDAGLFYLDRTAGTPRIMQRTAAGTRPVSGPIASLTFNRPALAVSADGQVVAWGQVDHVENDIMVVEGPTF